MPPKSRSSTLQTLSYITSVASRHSLDFLAPRVQQGPHINHNFRRHTSQRSTRIQEAFEHVFFAALVQASSCHKHRIATKRTGAESRHCLSYSPCTRNSQKEDADYVNSLPFGEKRLESRLQNHSDGKDGRPELSQGRRRSFFNPTFLNKLKEAPMLEENITRWEDAVSVWGTTIPKVQAQQAEDEKTSKIEFEKLENQGLTSFRHRLTPDFATEEPEKEARRGLQSQPVPRSLQANQEDQKADTSKIPQSRRVSSEDGGKEGGHERLSRSRNFEIKYEKTLKTDINNAEPPKWPRSHHPSGSSTAAAEISSGEGISEDIHQRIQDGADISGLVNRSESFLIADQINMLQMVRDLEQKLAKAKGKLDQVMSIKKQRLQDRSTSAVHTKSPTRSVQLTKDDYKNLVDLYFYSRHTQSSPDNPDLSPTPAFAPANPDQSPNPLFFDDYSFKLPEAFPEPDPTFLFDEDKVYSSPLKQVEAALKGKQLREVSLMMPFVDCLLDDKSSLSALFDIYKRLPSPGVAYLPTGVVRLFLQRMSTPFVKSEKSMLRYLSVIEDMQQAGLRINVAEWSSAVYLAGRSFARVTDAHVAAAFKLWRQMEIEAGVTANNVTFNILFDICVRAGKYALAETVLKEMQDRRLRLNRLGRVCLIWYHGLRGDGDGVRKAYHDFVDAGEIVDTLVLNTVMAAFLNAREPVAAEQVYSRMKDLQNRLVKPTDDDDSAPAYRRYPDPLWNDTRGKLAANHLGRTLLRAPRLKDKLPEKHAELQDLMPLTPDIHTFRAFIAYHATTSGELDTITYFLRDMTEQFGIPMTSVNYMLLFKGFALHGGSQELDATWSRKRLDQAWFACLAALKAVQQSRGQQSGILHLKPGPILPPAAEIDAYPETAEPQAQESPPKQKLSAWHEFVLDLAAFPQERRKPIERVHSHLFDHEMTEAKQFESPYFDPQQLQRYYASPEPVYDHEEGESTLPSPMASVSLPDQVISPSGTALSSQNSGNNAPRGPASDLRLTRPLICWLLRAYTKCTTSRDKVSEIYNTVRKIWQPPDDADRRVVIRVFQRCLRDCDSYGGYQL